MAVTDIVIVGAGRAGTGVGLALAAAGMHVTFLTRRPVPYIGPVRAMPWGHEDIPKGAVAFILAVPDRIISSVLDTLINTGIITRCSIVGHLSGAMTALKSPDIAGTFSSHPLYAFPPPDPPRPMPGGVIVTIEGDPVGVSFANEVFSRAGARVTPISPSARPLCHAAAVMAANLPAVLLFTCADALRACGVPDHVRTSAELLSNMASNIAESAGISSLTGPFVRGDLQTIAANLEALERYSSEVADLYRQLGRMLADRLYEYRILTEVKWKEMVRALNR